MSIKLTLPIFFLLVSIQGMSQAKLEDLKILYDRQQYDTVIKSAEELYRVEGTNDEQQAELLYYSGLSKLEIAQTASPILYHTYKEGIEQVGQAAIEFRETEHGTQANVFVLKNFEEFLFDATKFLNDGITFSEPDGIESSLTIASVLQLVKPDDYLVDQVLWQGYSAINDSQNMRTYLAEQIQDYEVLPPNEPDPLHATSFYTLASLLFYEDGNFTDALKIIDSGKEFLYSSFTNQNRPEQYERDLDFLYYDISSKTQPDPLVLETMFQEALEKYENNIEIGMQYAYFLETQDNNEAIVLYESLLEREPDNAALQYSYGAFLFNLSLDIKEKALDSGFDEAKILEEQSKEFGRKAYPYLKKVLQSGDLSVLPAAERIAINNNWQEEITWLRTIQP